MNINMLALYAKALIHKPLKLKGDNDYLTIPTMPETECEQTLEIRPSHCNAYNKLTNWHPDLASIVHPNYAQTLSLSLQLSLMVDKAFPFSPMGIVHIANQIKVKSLPEQTGSLSLRTHFGRVYYHKKGWLFEVVTLASSTNFKDTNKPQIKAISYYLAKQKHSPNIDEVANHDMPQWITKAKISDIENVHEDISAQQSLNFPSSIGRQYAKVSGDYNPIHLHSVTAKLFGFKKAIAHGMYSKALVISAIAKEQHFYKGSFEIDTLFQQAIALPTQASLKSNITSNKTCDFQLSSSLSRKERIFLSGSIK